MCSSDLYPDVAVPEGCATRHVAAASTSLRKDVEAVITLSEEKNVARVFRNGKVVESYDPAAPKEKPTRKKRTTGKKKAVTKRTTAKTVKTVKKRTAVKRAKKPVEKPADEAAKEPAKVAAARLPVSPNGPKSGAAQDKGEEASQ